LFSLSGQPIAATEPEPPMPMHRAWAANNSGPGGIIVYHRRSGLACCRQHRWRPVICVQFYQINLQKSHVSKPAKTARLSASKIIL
jgi:hypothetical protein